MTKQTQDSLEEIIEKSNTSFEPFVLDDGRVVFLGKVYKNMEDYVKNMSVFLKLLKVVDKIVRFFTFGKYKIIEYKTKPPQ